MSTLMITLLVAFVITVFAITCLAIGWLISGRSRIVRGSCGMNPQQSKDERCGKDVRCGICESEPKDPPDDNVHTTRSR